MDLQKNSQEYAYIDFSIAPPGGAAVDASMDQVTWTSVTFQNGEGVVLLTGPNCATSGGIPVLQTGPLWIRVTNAPEVIIRSAGIVNVY